MAADLIVSGRVARELLGLDSNLRLILMSLLARWPAKEMVITSIYRTKEENEAAGAKSKIHSVGPPFRAVDVRIRNLEGDYQANGEQLADEINAEWQYDPTRPSKPIAYAKVHGSGPHIHLQTHPNTTRR